MMVKTTRADVRGPEGWRFPGNKVDVRTGQLWADDDHTFEVAGFKGGGMWVELRNVKDGTLRFERYSRFGGCCGLKLMEDKNVRL